MGTPHYVQIPFVLVDSVGRRYHCSSEAEIRSHCYPENQRGPDAVKRDQLIARFKELETEYRNAREAAGLSELDRAREDWLARWDDMRERISTTPANSQQGVLLKVREMERSITQGDCEWDKELAQTAVADLERLIAGGAS